MTQEQFTQLMQLIGILVGAIIALSASGFVGLFVVLRQNKHALELVYHSADPATQQLIREIVVRGKQVVNVVKEAVDLADDVTDGVDEPTPA